MTQMQTIDLTKENFIIVDPHEIKVREELPRLRKEMGKIKELAKSIEKFGQLQPIVCTREMELIAGGRRLAASIEAGVQVKVVFSDTLDPLVMREMELEENIQRKPLTAAEEITAVAELHELKRQIHGGAVSGKEGSGWRVEDTAAIVGRTRSSITDDLALADALKDFPVLSNCKTKSDIRKAVKGLQKITVSVAALEQYEKTTSETKKVFDLQNTSCLDYMKTLEDLSIDVLFTDPPYGIDIHDVAISLGGKTGGKVTTTGTTYDDSFEQAMVNLAAVAQESARFVKKEGFAFVFCAISHSWIVRSMFEAAGWDCSGRPVIWIKQESGQNNAPSKWMSAGYEAALFARKIDSRLVVEGKVDWMQCPIVPPNQRIHQAEKPVAFIKEMLSRMAMPGAVVFDPFAGSAATLEAAIELKMYPIGCELSTETYALAMGRLLKYIEK